MNAGGVLKACKSNDPPKLARAEGDSGKRVRNTLVTCLEDGHNSSKEGLIPDGHEGTQVILV